MGRVGSCGLGITDANERAALDVVRTRVVCRTAYGYSWEVSSLFMLGLGTTERGTMIQPYADIDGDSNVRAFEFGPTWIDVYFHGTPKPYRYSHRSCGPYHCGQLNALALSGEGLNSYIMRNVKDRYER